MIEAITRECKKSGEKTRVTLERLIDVLDGNDDPMLVLLEAAKGQPINTTVAVYRVEEFGVNESLPPVFGRVTA